MKPQDLTVIFIGGHEHSGSTILDLCLQQHPHVVSVGEASKLERYAKGSRMSTYCRCGSLFSECPFWSRVADTATRMGRSLDTMTFDLRAPDYGTQSEIFFQAVAEATRCTTIVDSSKGIRRLWRLQTETRLRIVPVVVSRDLYSFLGSHRKRTTIGRLDAIALARRYISLSFRFRNILRGVPHVSLRLEDFAANQGRFVQEVYELAGLTPLTGWPSEAVPDEAVHNLGGNRLLAWKREPVSQPRAVSTGRLFNAPVDMLVRFLSLAVDVYPRPPTRLTTVSGGQPVVRALQ